MSGQTKVSCGGTTYTILPPTLDLLLEADLEYIRVKQECLFSFMSNDEARGYLIRKGLWTEKGDEDLKTLEEELETRKHGLYLAFKGSNFQSVKKHREQLPKLKRKLIERQSIRHQYDYLTVEGYASSAREEYIVARSILGVKPKGLHFFLLNEILSEINKSSISIDSLRHIARNDPWKIHWTLFGKDIFRNFPLTEEQKAVASFSQLYENIYKHPECPPETVIEDDDMLDGWLIDCRKENNKDKKSSKKSNSKIEQHTEIYQRAKSKEEAQEIYSGNSDEGRTIVKNRQKIKGTVKESQLPDKQQELQILATERMKNVKRR